MFKKYMCLALCLLMALGTMSTTASAASIAVDGLSASSVSFTNAEGEIFDLPAEAATVTATVKVSNASASAASPVILWVGKYVNDVLVDVKYNRQTIAAGEIEFPISIDMENVKKEDGTELKAYVWTSFVSGKALARPASLPMKAQSIIAVKDGALWSDFDFAETTYDIKVPRTGVMPKINFIDNNNASEITEPSQYVIGANTVTITPKTASEPVTKTYTINLSYEDVVISDLKMGDPTAPIASAITYGEDEFMPGSSLYADRLNFKSTLVGSELRGLHYFLTETRSNADVKTLRTQTAKPFFTFKANEGCTMYASFGAAMSHFETAGWTKLGDGALPKIYNDDIVTRPSAERPTAIVAIQDTEFNDAPYFFSWVEWQANGPAGIQTFRYTYSKHFEAGDLVIVPAQGTASDNMVTFVKWDDITPPDENEAKLSKLQYKLGDNFVTVPEFVSGDAGKAYPTIKLPIGTTSTEVAATALQDGASVTVSPSGPITFVNNAATVTVTTTSINGTASETYTVNFEVEQPLPNNAKLSALTYTVAGGSATAVKDFNATDEGGTYNVIVPTGTTSVTVGATKADNDATITTNLTNGVVDVSSGSGSATVTVTSKDSSKTNIFTINFTVEPAYILDEGNASITGTKITSETRLIAGSAANTFDYVKGFKVSGPPARTLESVLGAAAGYGYTWSLTNENYVPGTYDVYVKGTSYKSDGADSFFLVHNETSLDTGIVGISFSSTKVELNWVKAATSVEIKDDGTAYTLRILGRESTGLFDKIMLVPTGTEVSRLNEIENAKDSFYTATFKVEGATVATVKYEAELAGQPVPITGNLENATVVDIPALTVPEKANNVGSWSPVTLAAADADYTATYVAPSSDNAKLSALTYTVAGGSATAVKDFNATDEGTTTPYAVALPAGTQSVTIGATAVDNGATVTTDPADGSVDVSSGSGSATVTVISKDTSKTNIFTINFTVAPAYMDASASPRMIYYSVTYSTTGTANKIVNDYEQSNTSTEYTIKLPADATSTTLGFKPAMTREGDSGEFTELAQTVAYYPSATVNAGSSARVAVTSADGVYTNTYTIHVEKYDAVENYITNLTVNPEHPNDTTKAQITINPSKVDNGVPYYSDRNPQHTWGHLGEMLKGGTQIWTPIADSSRTWGKITDFDDVSTDDSETISKKALGRFMTSDKEYFNFTAAEDGIVYAMIANNSNISGNYSTANGWTKISHSLTDADIEAVGVTGVTTYADYKANKMPITQKITEYSASRIQYGVAVDGIYMVGDLNNPWFKKDGNTLSASVDEIKTVYYKAFNANDVVSIPVTGAITNEAPAIVIKWGATVLSNNAKLSTLTYTVANGSATAVTGFEATDEGTTTPYAVALPAGTQSVTIAATKADNGATVTTNPTNGVVDVSSGSGSATVTVTAQDGTTKTFTINFTVLSNNAKLSTLTYTVANGSATAVTGFATTDEGTTTPYAVALPAGTQSVTIAATKADNGATVTTNPTNGVVDVSSGSGSATVTVTAQDGTTKTFTINFTVLSNNAKLSALIYTVAGGSATAVTGFATTDEGGTYNVVVPTGITLAVIAATKADDDATVTTNPTNGVVDVSSGSGSATVTVTAQDGTTKTFTINFTVLSNNAKLSTLTYTVEGESATAVTGFATTDEGGTYNVTVPLGTQSVTIAATKADNGATVTTNPTNGVVDVSSGSGSATVTVTAQDGTTKTFTINFSVAIENVYILDENNASITGANITPVTKLVVGEDEKTFDYVKGFEIDGASQMVFGSVKNVDFKPGTYYDVYVKGTSYGGNGIENIAFDTDKVGLNWAQVGASIEITFDDTTPFGLEILGFGTALIDKIMFVPTGTDASYLDVIENAKDSFYTATFKVSGATAATVKYEAELAGMPIPTKGSLNGETDEDIPALKVPEIEYYEGSWLPSKLAASDAEYIPNYVVKSTIEDGGEN